MQSKFSDFLLKSTQSTNFHQLEVIQSLWSGYGKIVRLGLENGLYKTVVAKHVKLPKQDIHPRGWNTSISHNRKVKSYEVETCFYQNFASRLTTAKIPNCIGVKSIDDEVFIILEDLDAVGYPKRLHTVNWQQIEICLQWLARFHATYLEVNPVGLWEIGTYWHLGTRPEELEELTDIPLKNAASKMDATLNNSKFKTLVHGDAKLANFCFSEDEKKVAAVDFQYVGGGCGMKDVAYFIGSCLRENECEQMESEILDVYFKALETAFLQQNRTIDFNALETDWRKMYPIAWADFHRFLKGWSPGHWKINSYSEKVCKKVLAGLK